MFKYLDWDSNFFKIDIFFLEDEKSWKIPLKYDLLQACIPLENQALAHKLESNNFLFYDLNLTFNKKVQATPSLGFSNISIAKNNDIIQLKKIIKDLYIDVSRFNLPVIQKDRVNDFYYTWVEKAINGTFDDICFIYKKENIIYGFITLKINYKQKYASIGLIGTNKKYQSKKVGTTLIHFAEKFLQEKEIENILVQTQGKNISAQNFYIKNQFFIKDIKIWFYKY